MDDNLGAYLWQGRRLQAAGRGYLRCCYAPAFDAHIANSDYTAQELRAHAGVAEVAVCAMGVDAALFTAAQPDASLRTSLLQSAGGGEASVLVFYAGRLSPEKGLEVLVQATARLAVRPATPDVRLVLAGDGPAAGALHALAATIAPGRVHFAGNIADRTRLAATYASADVFVHPNAREPFGIGPLEAMATGVPVVVPNEGGVLSYANDGNAWLTTADAEGFARAILDARTGRGSARIDRARATARAHDWPAMARRYFGTLDRLHAELVASRSGVAGRIGSQGARAAWGHAGGRRRDAPTETGCPT